MHYTLIVSLSVSAVIVALIVILLFKRHKASKLKLQGELVEQQRLADTIKKTEELRVRFEETTLAIEAQISLSITEAIVSHTSHKSEHSITYSHDQTLKAIEQRVRRDLASKNVTIPYNLKLRIVKALT